MLGQSGIETFNLLQLVTVSGEALFNRSKAAGKKPLSFVRVGKTGDPGFLFKAPRPWLSPYQLYDAGCKHSIGKPINGLQVSKKRGPSDALGTTIYHRPKAGIANSTQSEMAYGPNDIGNRGDKLFLPGDYGCI